MTAADTALMRMNATGEVFGPALNSLPRLHCFMSYKLDFTPVIEIMAAFLCNRNVIGELRRISVMPADFLRAEVVTH